MAIYHFSAKVIGRSGGRSAIASAAYRAAERLHDDKLDRDHDYTAKAGVVHSEIMLPEGAPERWQDRGTLWNEVEAGEKRKDAQLARDIEISLPRELSQPEAIRLAQDFVREQFVARGMVADLNVHWTPAGDGELQPHAHVMLTMREVVPGREGHPEEGTFGKKAVAWNDRGLLRGWRERWAELGNERLAELGHDVRINHRSLADQGIALEPQNKIGPAGMRRSHRVSTDRDEDAERAAEHRAIARRNGEKLLGDPAIALEALTRQQSTFTRQDLARLVDRHTDGAEQFSAVMAKVEAAPELVRLGEDGRRRERFTTRAMLETEQRMERAAGMMAGREAHRVLLVAGWRAVKTAERGGLVLGDEQYEAYRHVTSGPDLSVVVGYAGSGKSAMLGVARQAWEAAGYTVRGAALSGIAAEGLEAGSGIASRTLASLEHGWGQGFDALTSRDVLVVDEAGMIGSRQMERVLSAAEKAGAKVVLVGDPEQLQAIEAGAAFRAIAERVGAVEITEVRRQREDWQREATRELATGRTGEALERYAAAGMVQGHATLEEARAAVIAGWDAARRQHPDESQIILAHTRADVAALNAQARAVRREAGELGEDQVLMTERGERAFADGERVYFLRNDRGLGVKNGTLGTLERIEGEGDAARLSVRLDDGRRVDFGLAEYAHIDHGYAATVHKSQGVTVDRTHVLATRGMDRHMAYVGLTRHREGVQLHWSADEMGDRAGLARQLGRERAKDTSLDYGAEPDARQAYAARRGLVVPESEIVVRVERQAEKPAPRRSRFAGLKLDASRVSAALRPERSMPAEPAPARALTEREWQHQRLEDTAADYARAWSDAARMRQAGLPALPHQEKALEKAGRALEGFGVNIDRDVRAALEATPELAHGTESREGRQALTAAAAATRRERLVLAERGRGAVRAWDALEREYEAAGRAYEWDAQRAAGSRLEAFAKALKRDPQLDRLLREHGRELGIIEDSRLDRVVQAREIDRALTRSIDLEHGPRLSRGMSLGR